MLLRAKDSDIKSESDILKSTAGILFFGTPHRSGNYTTLGEIARRIASASGFDTSNQNIDVLKPNSALLEDLGERFLKLYLGNPSQLKIHTFQEAMGLSSFGYTVRDKVLLALGWQFLSLLTTNRLWMIHLLHLQVLSRGFPLLPIIWICASSRTRTTMDTLRFPVFSVNCFERLRTEGRKAK